MTCFRVADETAVLGCAVVTLAPPPTLTPLPDADTPDFCNDSLPLVGLSLLVASPSAASFINPSPSSTLAPVDVVGVETLSLTLNSLPLPDAVPLAEGVEALPFVRVGVFVLGPAVELVDLTFDLDVPITLWSASGNVDEGGGAKIDNAPLVSRPEGAGLGPASLLCPTARGESTPDRDSPFVTCLPML